DVPKLRFPEDEPKYQKPEHIRGLLTNLDSKEQPAETKSGRRRWMAPALAGAIVLAFAAPPPPIASRSFPRSGCMSQSAGGSLAPRPFGSPAVAVPTPTPPATADT